MPFCEPVLEEMICFGVFGAVYWLMSSMMGGGCWREGQCDVDFDVDVDVGIFCRRFK